MVYFRIFYGISTNSISMQHMFKLPYYLSIVFHKKRAMSLTYLLYYVRCAYIQYLDAYLFKNLLYASTYLWFCALVLSIHC